MSLLLSPLNKLVACTVCWSGDDLTMNAANLAVGFMFLVLLTVLGSLLAFIFVLARRARTAGPISVPARTHHSRPKPDQSILPRD